LAAARRAATSPHCRKDGISEERLDPKNQIGAAASPGKEQSKRQEDLSAGELAAAPDTPSYAMKLVREDVVQPDLEGGEEWGSERVVPRQLGCAFVAAGCVAPENPNGICCRVDDPILGHVRAFVKSALSHLVVLPVRLGENLDQQIGRSLDVLRRENLATLIADEDQIGLDDVVPRAPRRKVRGKARRPDAPLDKY
jgi:hypothetical protein